MHKHDGFEAVAAASAQKTRDIPSFFFFFFFLLLLVFHADIPASPLLHGPNFPVCGGGKREENQNFFEKKKKIKTKNREAINHTPPRFRPSPPADPP